ncbi:MAG: helix-turn-helix domain-containing protein [Bacteroidales bacterium]|nr:helix-turn-helix domain-containing protein [Bacteroidales bacterium]
MLDPIHLRIRRTREQAGYSQTRMAEELGVGRTTYISFETGRSRLFNPLVDKMAACLGVSPEELLFGRLPDAELLRDQTRLDEWKRAVTEDYENRLKELQDQLEALRKANALQETALRALSSSNEYLLGQLRKDD